MSKSNRRNGGIVAGGDFFFCWLYRMGFMNQPCFLFKNWHFPVDQHGKANMVKPTIKTYSRHNVGD